METVLALGIAMLFLAGIFSLLSVGLTTTKDASDDTVIGLILRETSNRIRGTPLSPAPNQPKLYFFDNRGRFVDQDTGDTSNNEFLAVATVSTPDAIPSNANLLAVVVKVYPLPQPGQTTIPTTAPKATFSLLKTSTSGKGWKQLDPSYQPKIDLQRMKISRKGLVSRLLSGGFTVVELLLAASIFAIMLVFLVSLSDSVRKGWERGEHSVEVSQNGRAILNLLERDLSQAVVSRTMQFAQNPDLTALLPAGEGQVINSTSLLFWVNSKDAPSGLAQAGWYVAQNPAATSPSERFRLYRLHRSLSTNEALLQPGPADDLTRSIFWLTPPAIDQGELTTNSSVVFSGALGFWAACLDRDGNPIPDLTTADSAAAPLRFNSGARFQMSSRGTFVTGTKTSLYTDTASRTLAANSLPDSIRIVLLLTDERTLKRHATIDPIPIATLPAETEAIALYSEALAQKGIPNRIFSTTIKLMNRYDN